MTEVRSELSAVSAAITLAAPPMSHVSVWTRIWRTMLVFAGGAGAFAIAWTNPDRGHLNAWYPWAALATFLGVVSGSSVGSGLARWRDVNELRTVRLVTVLPVVSFFVLLATAALPVAVVVVGDAVSWRGIAFAAMAIVGGIPAGVALACIRALAIRGLDGSPGRQLAGLMRLRRLLGRLLSILGSLVVLLTLVNAAGLNWGRDGTVPASAVIFTGAAAAIAVGAIYIPTAAVLRRRCAEYIEEFFSLDDVDRGALVSAAENRSTLESLLGLDRTTLGELQAGLLVVSPLLASAGIALIPFSAFGVH